MDVAITDLSSTGAKFEVPMEDTALPKRFWLHMPRSGRIEDVEVVWRRGFEVGVCFAQGEASVTTAAKATAPRMSVAQLRGLVQRAAR